MRRNEEKSRKNKNEKKWVLLRSRVKNEEKWGFLRTRGNPATLPYQFVKIAESAICLVSPWQKKCINYKKKVKSDRFKINTKTIVWEKDSSYLSGFISSFFKDPEEDQPRAKLQKKSRHMLRAWTNNFEDHSTDWNTELSPFL